MNRRKMCIAFFMSLALFITSLPAVVFADNTEVPVHGPEGEDLISLTGVMIGGVDEPAEGQPLDETATVTSDNGMSWEIPAFWVDENFETALEYKENLSPLLAFYLPAGYTVEGSVLLDDYLTGVFNKIGHVETNYDEDTGITFIFGVVNVIYRSFSYGTAGNRAARSYEEPEDETVDDSDWDPGDLGDFEDEDDESSDTQTADAGQSSTNQTDNRQAAPDAGGTPSGQDDTSEKSLYDQFKEAYEGHYENVDWEKEAERFGGLDKIDWDQMADVIGYDNLRTIYENRKSYCDYITGNGGTEEDCSVLSGKIEASLEKAKPQSEESDANSDTESTTAKSERILLKHGVKFAQLSKESDQDVKCRKEHAATDPGTVAAADAPREGSSEEGSSTAAGEVSPDRGAQSDEAELVELSDEKITASEQSGEIAEETVIPEKSAPEKKVTAPEKKVTAPEKTAPEKSTPKKEAPKPEKHALKEEAVVPEEPDPADQNDSVREESKALNKETDKEND